MVRSNLYAADDEKNTRNVDAIRGKINATKQGTNQILVSCREIPKAVTQRGFHCIGASSDRVSVLKTFFF